jgi:hypothetical protein
MSCLNKLINHYFLEVVKPMFTFSDNETQFESPLWKGTMQNMMLRFDNLSSDTRSLIQVKNA